VDKPTMRTRFREAIADRASDLNDAAVDALLNTVWQFILPGEIDGVFREEDVSAALSTSNFTVDLDSTANFGGMGASGNAGRVRQVMPGVRLGDSRDPLDFYNDSETFYNRYLWNDVGTESGRPIAVLLQKRILTVHPVPDTFYELVIPASVYNAAIPSAGIANDDWALAVVRIAARDWTTEQGMDAAAQRLVALADDSKRRVQAQSRARPVTNRERRREFIDY
jgi:hypothetical protein